MLTIHHLDNSQSERIIWLCEELDIPYELTLHKRDNVTKLSPPALRALHPIGAAPVTEDNELLLAESAAIVEYIIVEHQAELVNAATPPAEKVLALKYLLHFVGDVHQPLHSADENDRGGNDKLISSKFSQSKKLHAFWDTKVVQAMGLDAATIPPC